MAKRLLPMIITLFFGSFLFFTFCSDEDNDSPNPAVVTLYDLVEDSKDHTILLTAIKAAGLEKVLKSGSLSLTLFAPTDAAFEKLPEGTLATLLEDPMNALNPILRYHVVNSKVTSADLSNGLVIEMVDKQKTMISIEGNVAMINEAKITAADIVAQNGVLHVIDAVLLPPANSVYQEIASNDMLATLKVAIDAVGMEQVLSDGNASFTLFAPEDDAFEGLPPGTVTSLLSQPDVLKNILLYHALSKDVYSSQLSNSMVETINGKDVNIKIKDGVVYVNDAAVEIADIICSNGVIHIINKVLIPPTE